MTDCQEAKLHVKFDGENLEHGTIDVYDLANTILAFSRTLEVIARNEGYTRQAKLQVDVSALRPGSFEVDLVLSHIDEIVGAAGAAAIALTRSESFNCAKSILEVFNGVITLKKFLKGKPAKDVKLKQETKDASVVVMNFNGDNMNISVPVYNAMQNKQVSDGIKKIAEPLIKEGGNVESIEFQVENKKTEEVALKREESEWYEYTDELQVTKDYQIKGTVTAFDRKTGNGRLTLQNGKRITFELDGISPKQYEDCILVLIESLKRKLPIYLKGDATFNFSSEIKKIKVFEVKSEAKLF